MTQTARPEILIFPDLEALSLEAANRLVDTANEAVNARGVFHLVLAGGKTPLCLYQKLAQPPYVSRIPWPAVQFYWGDERCVAPTHPESNFGQAKERLLKKVPVAELNLHRIKGELGPDVGAAEYQTVLRNMSLKGKVSLDFDLALLGLGEDGHTAALFPGLVNSEAHEATVVAVKAEYENRPAERITMTPLAFNSARKIIFLVSGSNKAKALKASLSDHYDPVLRPSQGIKPDNGTVTWLVDQNAAALL